VLRCTSDSGPEINEGTFRTLQTGTAIANYVGINRAATAGQQNLTYVRDSSWSAAATFTVNESRKFAQLTDGTSNVVVFGERAWISQRPGGANRNTRAGLAFVARGQNSWNNANGDSSTNSGMSDAGANLGGVPINFNANDNGSRGTLSSFHPGGAQVAMGDAKVTFFSENLDLTLARRLGGISDGAPASAP